MVIRRHRTPAVVTLLRVSGKTTHNPITTVFALVIALRSREEPLPMQGGRSRSETVFLCARTDSGERSDTHFMVTAA
jgi:hypothetical protein